MAAFRAQFGDERLMPMPLVTASEDVEPTLTTGIQALTVAARTWLRTGAPPQAAPEAVPASRQPADQVAR
ncbi:MAG TPA: hypothetical protein VGG54_15940 [Trebonia sp.]